MDNVKNFFAEREQAASGERRALDECITKYSQATNDIEQIALQSYSAKLCQLEADLHFDRENWKVDDDPITQRMTSYFQSSQYKNAFARLMGLSRYVKQPYTISYIAERVVVSRTTAHQFVKDCMAESWITGIQMADKTMGYWASDVLMIGLEEHAKYTSDQVETSGAAHDGALYRMARQRKVSLYSNQYKSVAD